MKKESPTHSPTKVFHNWEGKCAKDKGGIENREEAKTANFSRRRGPGKSQNNMFTFGKSIYSKHEHVTAVSIEM